MSVKTSPTPSIVTPLGTLSFNLITNELNLFHTDYTVYTLSESSFLFLWESDYCTAKLLIHKFEYNLFDDHVVDENWISVLHMIAKTDLENIDFEAHFRPISVSLKGWPNSGEYLEAITFDDEKIYVTIGTEDGEVLVHRSRNGMNYPSGLKQFLQNKKIDPLGFIKYFDNGLVIPIPFIPNGQLLELHFTLSWGPDEYATWEASGVCPNQAIRELLK